MVVSLVDTNPRKRPRQERAKQTVAAIMESTAQVLIRYGCDGTSTARVAERAGTSIGTLYQYFPNKEALLAGLVEQHANEILSVMRAALVETAYATLLEGLTAMVRAAVAAHLTNPTLHKAITEQARRINKADLESVVHHQIAQYVEQLLIAHSAEMSADIDFAVVATVLETTLEALTHKAVIEGAEMLAGDMLEEQILRMFTGYLGMNGKA